MNSELHELFSKYGALKYCNIRYDDLGRSLGTGVVEFISEEAAKKSFAEYRGKSLDDRPLDIRFEEIVVAKP